MGCIIERIIAEDKCRPKWLYIVCICRFQLLRTSGIIYHDIYIFFTNSASLLHVFPLSTEAVCFKGKQSNGKAIDDNAFFFLISKVCIYRCTLAISFCFDSILDFCVTKCMTLLLWVVITWKIGDDNRVSGSAEPCIFQMNKWNRFTHFVFYILWLCDLIVKDLSIEPHSNDFSLYLYPFDFDNAWILNRISKR